MNEQLERLEKLAAWHQSMADDYKFLDEPHAMGAVAYHMEQAEKYWHRYGWLKAEIETMKEWGGELALLPGRVLK
ncbi:hypothetical protein JQN58_05475 [Aneurinibacillus sp. BA2021]|nr:hypothetical protein [Aneurinibacillus sp. BA2021]